MKNVRIIKELDRLAQANGGLLLPDQVVQAARAKNSPLHSRFEWNDTEAAHQHRLWQARQLISICVQVMPGVNEPVAIYCSLSSDRGNGGGYRTSVAVCSNEQMSQQMLQDALHELNTFQKKYASLRQLADIFKAIRKVKRKAA